jgi:tetratricopeptide repeat protein/biogenesis AIM24-like protein
MRDPSPRAPFDQGLFLKHFNKGKALYDEKRHEEAERELEEAYLLRPRDQKVLNLLGLVYFKQDKYDKAEEVYRKLAAESPDAHTLFYNLGLIYFKLTRLEEAETAFMKALELNKDNPKINFYLGSIYERLHRFQDAIYQYRQAGANLMVRRVEDKIAAGRPPASLGAPAPPKPPVSSGDTKPLLAVRPSKAKVDDTAEFLAQDVARGLEEMENTLPPNKTLRPVSDILLAQNAPVRNLDTDTARFRLPPGMTSKASVAAAEAAGKSSAGPSGEHTLPPRRTETFRFLENNLMEIDFSGKVFIKQGTIYSYGGNLTFWVKDRRPGGQPALVIITGTGKVILTDKDREVTFMQVQDETIFIEPMHLLACEESLTPRYVPVGADTSGLEVLALEGRGMVALSVASKPLALPVTPDLPVSVPASSIITWSGGLTPHIVDDQQIYAVMAPASGAHPGPVIRLEGTGRVLVEQQATS